MILQMEDPSFFDRMLSNFRKTCEYYTGYPKDLGPSLVIHFTSEREFIKLLHEGCTRHLDRVLEEAAIEFYPNVKFMRVECPKYPGFCIARQRKEHPVTEIFHSPEQAANQGRVADLTVTRYNVKVSPFNYNLNAYGLREFFKRHGILASDPK